MKQLLLLAVAGLTTICALGQTRQEFYDHEWKKCSEKKASFFGQLIQTDSGVVVKDYYSANGQLQMTGKYAGFDRKIKNGHFTYYFADGSIFQDGFVEANLRMGLWKTYHPNGQLKSQLYYLNDKAVGKQQHWYNNGQLADSVYINNDTLMRVHWFSNGAVFKVGPIDKTRKNPIHNWTYFRKNGTKMLEIVWDKNTKELSRTYYDEQGAPQAEYNGPKIVSHNYPSWEDYVKENLKAPEHVELPKGKKKIVVVAFNLDDKGEVINAFVKVPLHPEYDKIALALLNNSPKLVAAKSTVRNPGWGHITRIVDFDKIKKKK